MMSYRRYERARGILWGFGRGRVVFLTFLISIVTVSLVAPAFVTTAEALSIEAIYTAGAGWLLIRYAERQRR